MCFVWTAHFTISAVALNEHLFNKSWKGIYSNKKVPGSVDALLLIFNWTQRGLETGFLASAIPSIRSASTRQRGRERIWCDCQSRPGGPGAEWAQIWQEADEPHKTKSHNSTTSLLLFLNLDSTVGYWVSWEYFHSSANGQEKPFLWEYTMHSKQSIPPQCHTIQLKLFLSASRSTFFLFTNSERAPTSTISLTKYHHQKEGYVKELSFTG